MSEQAFTPQKIRVAVVFGGASTEHSISCVTAGSVMAALDPDRYDVIGVGITAEGTWVRFAGTPQDLAIRDGVLPRVSAGTPVVLHATDAGHAELVSLHEPDAPRPAIDVVFPLLHGPYGEDGTVQGLLELARVPYVGSGVFASAAGMDKHFMKVVLAAAGLPILPFEVITDAQWRTDPDAAQARAASLEFPVFVKPARGGSSIGITRVTAPDALAGAIEAARQCDPKVIVEANAGPGVREIECGVLGAVNGGARASAIAEITLVGDYDFYDFDAKYLDGDAVTIDLPADLEDQVRHRVEDLSVRAFEALECEGLARVDFFVLGSGEVALNEINTMPGFTPSSMFPRMWASSGVDYATLADTLIELALSRRLGLR